MREKEAAFHRLHLKNIRNIENGKCKQHESEDGLAGKHNWSYQFDRQIARDESARTVCSAGEGAFADRSRRSRPDSLLNFQMNPILVSSTLQLKCRTDDHSRPRSAGDVGDSSKWRGSLFGLQTSGQLFHLSQTDSNRQRCIRGESGRIFCCNARRRKRISPFCKPDTKTGSRRAKSKRFLATC